MYNAARRSENLKAYMSKDKLVINGDTFSVDNLHKANDLIDITSTCERSDGNKILFLGSLSPYSNLYPVDFTVENVMYNSVEQYLQSQKASMFDDDISQVKIMRETNPYKIRKLGSKVKKYSHDRWRRADKQLAYKVVYAKFVQNQVLREVLVKSGSKQLMESSTDPYWGAGLHLHDKNALDKRCWPNKEGGVMSEILHRVHRELKKPSQTQHH